MKKFFVFALLCGFVGMPAWADDNEEFFIGSKAYRCGDSHGNYAFGHDTRVQVLGSSTHESRDMGVNRSYLCQAKDGWEYFGTYDDHWEAGGTQWCSNSEFKENGINNATYCIYADGVEQACTPLIGDGVAYKNGCIKATCNIGYSWNGSACVEKSGGSGNGGNNDSYPCPAGSSEDITSADKCSGNQMFECTRQASGNCQCGKCVEKNNSGVGDGRTSLQRCLDGRTSAEGRACCYLPRAVATWDGAKCNCVAPNMEFKIGSDGRGQCNAKVTAPGETFNCDSTVLGVLDGWMVKCAAKADIVSIIGKIKTLCQSSTRTAEQFNTLYQTLLALNPGDCAELPVQTINQPAVPVINETVEKLKRSRRKISDSYSALRGMSETFKVSVWKDEEGKFNTARLASDSIAAVVLGTTGALVTSNIVKKNQVENGFEDIKCVIGGQTVAEWGDEFRVGIQ